MSKQFLNNCLSFTRKDRNGITVLLLLILFFTAFPFLYPLLFKREIHGGESFDKEMALLKAKKKPERKSRDASDNEEIYARDEYMQRIEEQPAISKSSLFYFDPNTATTRDLQKLGLSSRNIRTIQNFVSKGGRFRKAEDIGKIWGMKESDIQRLIPYIQIQEAKNPIIYFKKDNDSILYHKNISKPTILDINTADSISFLSLPGIGPKLSQRIIKFRENLGGFYSTNQIAETYGLPDSVFQKIQSRLSVKIGALKKININTASVDEMKGHPYLRYAIANAIVQYRMQHGNYNTVDQIKKIMMVTNEVFEKVYPYLISN